jgi:hypothetical protein
VKRAEERVLDATRHLISTARSSEAIPPGAPTDVLALAVMGALEGLVINLARQAPFDEMLAEKTVLGLLGLPPRDE